MASIKKILADSFEDVKASATLVHEINKENLEIVKAINRANLDEVRRMNHDILDALTEEDASEEETDDGKEKSAD